MSDPNVRTSEPNWNENPIESSLSQNEVMSPSITPWTVKCLSRDTSLNFLRLDTSLFHPQQIAPTTTAYYQTSPQSTSSFTVQPDSPSSVDDYPELTSADEDTLQLEIRAKRFKGSERLTNRKSFTIDAILGLGDLAASLKNKGNCNSRLPSSHNQEPLSGRHSSPHFGQQKTEASGMTPASGSSSRSKRVRTIFSAEQLEKLEAEFARQQYMVGPERLVLAASLRLSESQVKVWFQNRRIKWRKQHLEARQMRFPNWQQDDHIAHHHNFAQMFQAESLDDTLESLSD